MNKIYLIIIFSFINQVVYSQFYSLEAWHKGSIHLQDGTVVDGIIKYDFENNLISFKQKNNEYTLNTNSIKSFELDDFIDSTHRYFSTFLYTFENEYSINMLFEVLTKGHLTLLCREKIAFKPGGSMATNSSFGRGSYELEYSFFIHKKDENVRLLTSKKKIFKTYFKDFEIEMKNYFRENSCTLRSKKDIISIFEYYNSLKKNNEAINFSN